MDLQLSGKKALVTGSTAGIGLAIAKMLHAEGASVVINGRTDERVEGAIREIRGEGSSRVGSVQGFVGDLSRSSEVERLKAEVPSVDILVNNLGVFEARDFQEIDDEQWSEMLNVNVLSGARLSRLYLPAMKAKDWGRVIFIASETGVNVPADMVHYGVSKAAQIALARGLAETTVGSAVTVNSVLPGPTLSEGITRFLNDVIGDGGGDRERAEREFLERLRPTSLIKRFARAEEVASLVTYLASPLSSATNGAALRVEGGLLRSIY